VRVKLIKGYNRYNNRRMTVSGTVVVKNWRSTTKD